MLSEASGRCSYVVKWFIWLGDTWPEWRSSKHYQAAAPDLSPPTFPPSPSVLLSPVDCFAAVPPSVHIPFTRIPLHPVPEECVCLCVDVSVDVSVDVCVLKEVAYRPRLWSLY